jgi:hypothetical protein
VSALCVCVAPPSRCLCQHCCFFCAEKKAEREGKDGEEQKLGGCRCCVAALLLFVRDLCVTFLGGGAERQLDEVKADIDAAKTEVDQLKRIRPDFNDEKAYAAWKVLFDAATKREDQLRKEKEQLRKEKEQLRKKEEQLREEKMILLRQNRGRCRALLFCFLVCLCWVDFDFVFLLCRVAEGVFALALASISFFVNVGMAESGLDWWQFLPLLSIFFALYVLARRCGCGKSNKDVEPREQ